MAGCLSGTKLIGSTVNWIYFGEMKRRLKKVLKAQYGTEKSLRNCLLQSISLYWIRPYLSEKEKRISIPLSFHDCNSGLVWVVEYEFNIDTYENKFGVGIWRFFLFIDAITKRKSFYSLYIPTDKCTKTDIRCSIIPVHMWTTYIYLHSSFFFILFRIQSSLCVIFALFRMFLCFQFTYFELNLFLIFSLNLFQPVFADRHIRFDSFY